MKPTLFIAFILLISLPGNNVYPQMRGDVRVMFYNTENFFDTRDDPATRDDEFTPGGRLHWTEARYKQKLINIFKVIAAIGGDEPPEIIGLSEVENQKVLVDLIFLTPLSKYNYGIVHFDSPDPRGIDVALLYRKEKIKILKQRPLPVSFKKAKSHSTRDILYVQLLIRNLDTLNIFVNHWPSRLHGENETEFLREQAAWRLRMETDSLFALRGSAKIIIMGDFNDEPFNKSISITLNAQKPDMKIHSHVLYNLSEKLCQTSAIATHQYKGHWEMFDQFIVSGGLLLATCGLTTATEDAHIFTDDFLFTPKNHNFNPKPWTTYSGPIYTGGFSDHLPIYLDLYLKK